jgi:hypothetical protein
MSRKKTQFLLQRGVKEVVWRLTPDFLDLGQIVADSRRPINSRLLSIEGALAFALSYSTASVVKKLIRAGFSFCPTFV